MATSAASIALYDRKSRSMQFQVTGLSNPPSAYTQFRVTIGGTSYTWTDGSTAGSSSISPWFSGLSAGSQYTIYGYATSGGVEYTLNSGSSISQWTNDPPTAPSGVSSPTFGNGGLTGTVTFTKGSQYSGVSNTASSTYQTKMSVSTAGGSVPSGNPTTGSSLGVQGSAFSTTYYFTVWSIDSDGAQSGSVSGSFTTGTAPPTPVDSPTASFTPYLTSMDYTQNSVANATYYYLDIYEGSTMRFSQGSPNPNVGTWTGLKESTTYTIKSYARSTLSGYTDSSTRSYSATTKTTPGVPTTGPSITARVEGGFDLSWGSSTNATSYVLQWVRHWDGQVNTRDVGNYTTYSLRGIDPGTAYDLSVKGRNSAADSAYTVSNSGTTNPKTPTVSVGSITSTTITINVSGMTGDYSGIEVYRATAAGGASVETIEIGSGTSATFSNLALNTTYYFKAKSHLTAASSTVLWSLNNNEVSAKTANLPSKWKWTSAADANGHKVDGNYSMLATEWNSFATRINDFRTAKGLTTYSFTSAVKGNAFTAAMFNQAIYAITDIPGRTVGLPATVNTSDPVTVMRMNGVMDAVNSTT